MLPLKKVNPTAEAGLPWVPLTAAVMLQSPLVSTARLTVGVERLRLSISTS